MGPPLNEWRSVIAVFANPDTRLVAAHMMLGMDLASASSSLATSKRRKVVEALTKSGLVDRETGEFKDSVFRSVLDRHPIEKREGIGRFLDGSTIRQYPANLEDRGTLLEWVAKQALGNEEVLSEPEMNDRLRPFSADVAVLRRYLVDYQLIERRADGTRYALTGTGPVVSLG